MHSVLFPFPVGPELLQILNQSLNLLLVGKFGKCLIRHECFRILQKTRERRFGPNNTGVFDCIAVVEALRTRDLAAK